jgi:hypothetical protein
VQKTKIIILYNVIMSTLTLRSSPSHGPATPTSYGKLLSTRSQSDILVPKPVKANLEFASPNDHGHEPLSRSSSAQAFDNYPLPQTPVRSANSFNNVNGPVADGLSSSPERLAEIEIKNILFQRVVLESSSFIAPKSPAPMFKLIPTTPTTVKKNLNRMFDTCTKEDAPAPSAEEHDEEDERPNLDRTTSFPSMTSSRDSCSFFHPAEQDDSYSDEEDIFDSDDEDDYYHEEANFRMFGIYGSDDDDNRTLSHDGKYTFRSMTPPERTENPLCFDDRFQHFSSVTPVPERKRMEAGVELGLFRFSPIPSQI